MRTGSSVHSLQFTPEKLGIDGDDHCADAHQQSTQCRIDQDPRRVQHSCSQRDGHHIVA